MTYLRKIILKKNAEKGRTIMDLISLYIFYYLVTVISASEQAQTRDYCKVSCKKTPHIGCPIPKIPNISDCSGFKSITYNSIEKKEILAYHNKKRNLVASGLAMSRPSTGTHWHLPKGSNINCLGWDDELELLASYNVRQCKVAHDVCRNTDTYVGQNLFEGRFFGYFASNIRNKKVYKGAIESWYNEINLLDEHQISSFNGANGIGHFSQVIWANTTKIGCASAKWTDGKLWRYLVCCNYAVGGNFLGVPIYSKGHYPGSQCEVKDVVYRHLCTKIKEK